MTLSNFHPGEAPQSVMHAESGRDGAPDYSGENLLFERKLAEQIRQFWKARGLNPYLEISPATEPVRKTRGVLYHIRSDMKNGMPQRSEGGA